MLSLQDLGRTAFKVISIRLTACSQVIGQELLGESSKRDLVGRACKSMALIGIQDVANRNISGDHGVDNLIRLCLLHTRVVGSLTDEQRLLDVCDMSQRRALSEELPAFFGLGVTANSENHIVQHSAPVRRDRVEQSDEVTGTNKVNTAAENIGSES